LAQAGNTLAFPCIIARKSTRITTQSGFRRRLISNWTILLWRLPATEVGNPMRDNSPSFFHGISFQLAKIGIILAFVLSFLMSSAQLYLDFRSQKTELEDLIQRVIQVATPPAARSVQTLDDELSDEVVNGLLRYGFIYEVEITDE